MAYQPIITDSDVVERFRSEEDLRQCFRGVQDLATVDSTNFPKLLLARRDATGKVSAACGNNWRFWRQAGEYPLFVVQLAARLAVVLCWEYGTGGLALPQHIRDMKAECEADLIAIRRGEVDLGGDPNPPARKAGPIDNSGGGRRAVHSTWRLAGPLGSR